MAEVHLLRADGAGGTHQGATCDGAGPGEPDPGRGRLARPEAGKPRNGRADRLGTEVLQPGSEDHPLRDAQSDRSGYLRRSADDPVRVRGADATFGSGRKPEASGSVRNIRGRQLRAQRAPGRHTAVRQPEMRHSAARWLKAARLTTVLSGLALATAAGAANTPAAGRPQAFKAGTFDP